MPVRAAGYRLNEMAPSLKRQKRKRLQKEEESSGNEEVFGWEDQEEEIPSEDDSDDADSEHDVEEHGFSSHAESKDAHETEGSDDADETGGSEDAYETEGSEDANEIEGLGQNGSHGGEELEKLEKEYRSLQEQEQSILGNLKRQRDEDQVKGQAIKNQKTLWNRSLEFRFLLQKAFTSSNKLPQEPLRSKFCHHDRVVEDAYSDLILSSEKTLNSMLELQKALLDNNPSISQDNCSTVASNDLEIVSDDKWFQIQSLQSRIAPFSYSSIDKWQRKTQVTSGAAAIKGKLHAFNQNISDQVAAYMRDPSQMIRRMQLKRSAVGILGEEENVESAGMDGDPELIDDSEFYQQLLKEFFESLDLASDPNLSILRKSQTRKRKTVDRRASKSRKIRYNVHEKIVNFMAPKPMVLPLSAPQLFESLFGLRKKEPASTF